MALGESLGVADSEALGLVLGDRLDDDLGDVEGEALVLALGDVIGHPDGMEQAQLNATPMGTRVLVLLVFQLNCMQQAS